MPAHVNGTTQNAHTEVVHWPWHPSRRLLLNSQSEYTGGYQDTPQHT